MYNLYHFTVGCVLFAIASSFAQQNFVANNPNQTTSSAANGTVGRVTLSPREVFEDLNPTNLNETQNYRDLKKREYNDAEEIYNTGIYPFSAVGIVQGSTESCTGTLVGPHHVLMPASCGDTETPLSFAITKRESQNSPNIDIPTRNFKVKGTHYFDGWRSKPGLNVALLVLEGERAPIWMPLYGKNKKPGPYVIGFPKEKRMNTMWKSPCRITKGTRGLVKVETQYSNIGAVVYTDGVIGMITEHVGENVNEAVLIHRHIGSVICHKWIDDPAVKCEHVVSIRVPAATQGSGSSS